MSTFLELCNDVERDSGTVATTAKIVSVANPPTPRQAKIVGWVRDAWRMVQRARTDWLFMRHSFASTIVAGQSWYSAGDLGISDFGAWMRSSPTYSPITIQDAALDRNDENGLTEIEFTTWQQRYNRRDPDRNRPTEYAIGPSGELCFGANPDRSYIVRGDYRRSLQSLSADADVPRLPEDFHEIIRYRALMLMGNHDEAPVLVASAGKEFGILFTQLVKSQVATGPIRLDGLVA